MYPRDWPIQPRGDAIEEILAIAGQQVVVHLGVFARRRLKLTASATAPEGTAVLPPPELAYGRYLPMRPYGVGAAWLEVNHSRPQPAFEVGPELSRSLIVEFDIPPDAGGGSYTSTIALRSDGIRRELELEIRVIPVELEPIPIPVGLFMNALTIRPDLMDEHTWWRLQESLLAEQSRAGLNCPTGGPGLDYQVLSQTRGDVEISGDSATRYIRLAVRFGPIPARPLWGISAPSARDRGE